MWQLVNFNKVPKFLGAYFHFKFHIKHGLEKRIKQFPFGYINCFKNNDIMMFFINSSCFLYIITHPDICYQIYKILYHFDTFDVIKNHELYRKEFDEHYIFTDVLPIKMCVLIDSKYTKILRQLDNLKNIKIQYIKNKFEEIFKYCDYAVEECFVQEKFMMTIERMNMFNDELDNIITTLITEPIRKHICCISTIASFDLSNTYDEIMNNVCYKEIYKYMFFQKN